MRPVQPELDYWKRSRPGLTRTLRKKAEVRDAAKLDAEKPGSISLVESTGWPYHLMS
jgi:hypothetical protein